MSLEIAAALIGALAVLVIALFVGCIARSELDPASRALAATGVGMAGALTGMQMAAAFGWLSRWPIDLLPAGAAGALVLLAAAGAVSRLR